MMKQEMYKKIKCDCRDCENSGPVENFMVTCSREDKWKKSIGTRVCGYFKKKNVRQDNNESDG